MRYHNRLNCICIYTIAHPVTNDIVYVGSTANWGARWSSHYYPNKSLVSQWIQLLKKLNQMPLFEVVERTSKENSMKAEKNWIVKLYNEGHPLLNKNKLPKSNILVTL